MEIDVKTNNPPIDDTNDSSDRINKDTCRAHYNSMGIGKRWYDITRNRRNNIFKDCKKRVLIDRVYLYNKNDGSFKEDDVKFNGKSLDPEDLNLVANSKWDDFNNKQKENRGGMRKRRKSRRTKRKRKTLKKSRRTRRH